MKKNNQPIIHRGEVYYADLSPVIGSEQGGCRPIIILQNDVGNKFSPTTIIAPITSRLTKHPLPTHVALNKGECGLPSDSMILLEQVKTIDKQRLKEKMGVIEGEKMGEVAAALNISLGLV
jgi:mRNA interferase MazF